MHSLPCSKSLGLELICSNKHRGGRFLKKLEPTSAVLPLLDFLLRPPTEVFGEEDGGGLPDSHRIVDRLLVWSGTGERSVRLYSYDKKY